MAEWSRSTRDTTVEHLPVAARAAINEHIERHNLGPILNEWLGCIVTDSSKVKKGFFSPGAKHTTTTAVITPAWLLWVLDSGDAKPAVLSARLADVTIVDYQKTPAYKLIEDTGLEVSGAFTDMSERVSAFLALGDDAAGREFKEIALQSAQDAKE